MSKRFISILMFVILMDIMVKLNIFLQYKVIDFLELTCYEYHFYNTKKIKRKQLFILKVDINYFLTKDERDDRLLFCNKII